MLKKKSEFGGWTANVTCRAIVKDGLRRGEKCGFVHRVSLSLLFAERLQPERKVELDDWATYCSTCRAEADMQNKARVFLKAKAKYGEMLAKKEARIVAGRMPKSDEPIVIPAEAKG